MFLTNKPSFFSRRRRNNENHQTSVNRWSKRRKIICLFLWTKVLPLPFLILRPKLQACWACLDPVSCREPRCETTGPSAPTRKQAFLKISLGSVTTRSLNRDKGEDVLWVVVGEEGCVCVCLCVCVPQTISWRVHHNDSQVLFTGSSNRNESLEGEIRTATR